MERRVRQRDEEIEERCGELESNLCREEGYDMVEGVVNFKYLGKTLDQMDDDWPVVSRNIVRVLGKLMRGEGAEPKVSAMLYRAVEQAVLLFGSDTWLILAGKDWKIEVAHKCFISHITWQRSRQIADGKWEMPGTEVVWETAVTQSVMTNIGRRQAIKA